MANLSVFEQLPEIFLSIEEEKNLIEKFFKEDFIEENVIKVKETSLDIQNCEDNSVGTI